MTKDQVAQIIVGEAKARNHTRDECLGELSALYQESEWDETIWDATHTTYGVAQQDGSYPHRFEGAAAQVKAFFDKLDKKRTSPGHGDIWLNICWLQQAPNWPSAQYWWEHGRQAYLSEIKSRIDTVTPYLNKYWPDGGPVTDPPTGGAATLADPRTITDLNSNCYAPRGLPAPMWIACHTSESMSRVRNLNNFCKGAGVSYNRLVDDRDILVAVEDGNAPWAAMGANKYAYHICWTSSFAAWSRGAWLDSDAANDGIDERQALRNGAKQIAYWIEQSDLRDHRPIPAVWMGGGSIPPWGRDGLCGHVDFGAWGGGHHDPGPNFPQDVLLSDVRELLTGVAVTPPPPPVPVVAPGTKPDAYSDWMLYRGNPRNDVDRVMRVQHRLKFAYAEYGGHLEVDGDFGPMTYAAVCEFQRRSSLIVDGIVGPSTAAALKP